VRVLLVSGDRPFRAATAALLARRGAFVETAGTDGEGAALAETMRADVLVYDLSGSAVPRESHARLPEEIRLRVLPSPAGAPAGIVLVGEIQEHEGVTVLDRWGEFGTLFAAIVEADRRRPPLLTAALGPSGLRAV
jgi:DNA-binding NarL/FixJ family response regulator